MVAEEGKMLSLFPQREHRVHRPTCSGIHDGSVEQKGDFRSRSSMREER